MPDLIIRGAAQDNIHNYYDRGNEFYRLWLDKELAYSCTYTS